MCENCGCDGDAEATIAVIGKEIQKERKHVHPKKQSKTISVNQDVLQKNNLIAERNRGYFAAKNITCINLVSSPGSGKTTLLEQTIKKLTGVDIYVIEGDQQTSNDAERIDNTGVPVVQINTGDGCHLDANMIHNAVEKLTPKAGSLLFIENVGNLVCPAMFDLGESHRVVIISVTEGDDKPIKYPNMFASSQVCVINKMDLLPYVDFDLDNAKQYAKQTNPNIAFMELSATAGANLGGWCDWLEANVAEKIA